MGQRKIIPVSGENNTTSTAWVTLATLTVSSDCSILINDIFVVGTVAIGASSGSIGTATAVHRAKRVTGVLSLVGSLVYLVTFNSGSDSAVRTAQLRISVSGNDLLLQVSGISGTVAWYGGFTAILD